MATVNAQAGAKASDDTGESDRISPNLRDLMSLARPAMHLPGWHQRAKRQTQGAYLSALRGRGMEYDESRPYQAGDDIRTLDWRVTARTGKPHTKLFREERERPVYVCCDLGRTMRFATRGAFKSVVAARAAALIAWKAQQSGDRIGGVVFNDVEHLELPPSRGKEAVARMLKGLVSLGSIAASDTKNGEKNISLSDAVLRLQRLAKPGSLVFIISDFRFLALEQQATQTGAAMLAQISRHSDTFALAVADPLETAAPAIKGRCQVSDGPNKLNLNFGNRNAKQTYREMYEERDARLKRFCSSNKIKLENIMTNDEPLRSLERLLR
ncbi:MAG: DUF58 domain-containing protein [Pseudomonadota bacterium]